jgi:5S rRNA maturation endonuclease (ribonuclease M5)
MGTDLLIIEKEGVAEVLAPMHYSTLEASLQNMLQPLSELSKKNGCNVAILTDFDASGLLLAKKVCNIYRVGIDFSTLRYFGLTSTEVEEAYEPDNNHMKPLKDIALNSEAKDEENYALTKYLKFMESCYMIYFPTVRAWDE